MTRFPASGGGSGPPYTYVMDGYPSDAEEGESLYHITEDAAYVYTGSSWVEQTVTNHGQLAGVSEGDHRSDSRVSDLAPVQSVNGGTGNVTIGQTSVKSESGSHETNIGSGGTYNQTVHSNAVNGNMVLYAEVSVSPSPSGATRTDDSFNATLTASGNQTSVSVPQAQADSDGGATERGGPISVGSSIDDFSVSVDHSVTDNSDLYTVTTSWTYYWVDF